MAKFGFGDIITLAKSGWTPDAVNNIIDRMEALPADDDSDNSDSKGADDSDNLDDSKGADDSDDSKGAEDDSDDKDAKIAELEKQLAEAQKQNRQANHDTGEKKTIDDLVDDIFKEYFD